MLFIRKLYALSIFYLLAVPSAAQSIYYDFDSLLEHNSNFKQLAKQVFDTFQIFGPEEPLNLTVSTDFRSLMKNKFEDEYQPAMVMYQLWDSINISRQIRIKPRGERRLKMCSQPPLMVNVKKTKPVFQLLDDLHKLKLVIPCREINTYQEYIFSEYLIYKLYNVLTDNSFKVRMIKLNYFDTSNKVKSGSSYTFIIESHESLAQRRHCLAIENESLNRKLIDPSSAALLYLFQYMVGNTDWSISGLHNIKLLKTMDPTITLPIAVPYDFDYAGLVNANYAVPNENTDIDQVTERAYMGHCLPPELMEQTYTLFKEKQDEIMAIIEQNPYLSDYRKKRTLKYVEEFFKILDNPKRRQFEIDHKCL